MPSRVWASKRRIVSPASDRLPPDQGMPRLSSSCRHFETGPAAIGNGGNARAGASPRIPRGRRISLSTHSRSGSTAVLAAQLRHHRARLGLFKMPMICSSENRFRFMRPSLSLGRTLAPSGENAGVTSSSTTGVRRLAARSAEGALEQGSPLITELVGTFGYCFIPWRLAASPRAFICARTSTSKLAFKPEEENGGMSKIPGLPHRAQTAISSLWRRPCRSIPKNGFFRPFPRAAGPIACHGARERHRHRSRCCEYSAHRLR